MYYRLLFFFFLFLTIGFTSCTQKRTTSFDKHLDLEKRIGSSSPLVDSLMRQSNQSEDSLLLGYLHFYKMKIQFHSSNLDSILYHADKTYEISRAYKDPYLSARTNQLLGRYYAVTGDYPRSLELFLSATSYFKSSNDSLQLIFSYNDLGGFYIYINDLEKAQSFLSQSFQLATAQNNLRGKTFYYANMSTIHQSYEQYDRALENINLAMTTFEQLKDTVNQIKVFASLGDLYYNLKNLPEAKQNYNQAKILIEQSKKDISLGRVLLGYGKIEEAQNSIASAINYYEQAYEANHRLKLQREEIDALEALYKLYDKQKKYDQALFYLSEILNKKEALNGKRINQKLEEIRWNSILAYNQHQYELEQQKHKTTVVMQICLILLVGGLTLLFAVLYYSKRKRLHITQVVNDQLKDKIKTEKILKELQEEKHLVELENKDRELTMVNIQLLSKNKFLNDIDQLINSESENLASKLKEVIRSNRNLEKDWEQFILVFEKVHPTFFQYIHQNFPKLSKTEIKICAYIKINFSNYEIASLLHIDYQTVIKNRYRIRKKINLSNTEDLDKTIASW